MASDAFFGELEGLSVGTLFSTREELSRSGVRRPRQAGICGSLSAGGAESIVVSGGYEDDQDLGEEIIYTGHGGRDVSSGRQVADQDLKAWGNRALAANKNSGLPVGVVRGSSGDREHSPERGYRYDGLFDVEEFWLEKGRSGFKVVRFRLKRRSVELIHDEIMEEVIPFPAGKRRPNRTSSVVTRIIRDTEITRSVKRLHRHR
jgi:putative restriction endonuclease